MLIGLSGYARSGKDTAGQALVEIGFTRVSFADKLREFLLALNPLVSAGRFGDRRIRDLVDSIGWEAAKSEFVEVRELLQRVGTEAGRGVLGDNVWVDAVLRDLPEKVVVTDCRYPNEAQSIKGRGGIVVRIDRPGFEPVNPHPSEVGLDDWPFDYRIPNDGTVADLHQAILAVAATEDWARS